jgi:site-specific DNA-methyltransferase (adenine-specific)
VFVRRNEAVEILRKVLSAGESTFDTHVSPRKPFGLPTNFFGASSPSGKSPIKLHSSGKVTWVGKSQIPARADWVEKWKVLVGRATDGNENYPLPIWDKRGPFVAGPGEACTETYLVAAVVENEKQARRVVKYMSTTFFRFLVSLRKITQDNKAEVFAFVPDLPMDREWTDELLVTRYGLGDGDVSFMKCMIRDAEFTG